MIDDGDGGGGCDRSRGGQKGNGERSEDNVQRQRRRRGSELTGSAQSTED